MVKNAISSLSHLWERVRVRAKKYDVKKIALIACVDE